MDVVSDNGDGWCVITKLPCVLMSVPLDVLMVVVDFLQTNSLAMTCKFLNEHLSARYLCLTSWVHFVEFCSSLFPMGMQKVWKRKAIVSSKQPASEFTTVRITNVDERGHEQHNRSSVQLLKLLSCSSTTLRTLALELTLPQLSCSMAKFTEALSALHSIQHLHLNFNQVEIGDAGLSLICQIPQLYKLYSLSLWLYNNALTDVGIKSLLVAQRVPAITLNLASNQLTDETATVLAHFVHSETLRVNLCDNKLTDEGVTKLRHIGNNSNLVFCSLVLRSNNLQSWLAVSALVDGFLDCRDSCLNSLTLNLAENRQCLGSGEGLDALLRLSSIHTLHTLKLQLWGIPLSVDARARIQEQPPGVCVEVSNSLA
eukprot:TRINITY_DN32235_c0_g1_i1.p1 TRINITY_DN32235_c0_g1~~TRINITY_DN32235_c0_g1_i1.p1  ORF type:complete len:371 (+),score=14.97 TRINITY_DN32235_c0_g1_i1:100-1212(+)